MKVTFSISGAKEMERLLFELGHNVARRVGGQAVFAGAKIIMVEAKARAPVRTGGLRASIIAVPLKQGNEDTRISAQVGFLKPTSRRAHLTEFGTKFARARPFITPAMDNKAQAALDEMGRVLAKGIEREAKKLAKGRIVAKR